MWRTLLCATFLLAGCATNPAARKPRPHVILISLDTLSAEHMDLYGYNRPTMPFLKRLGEQSVVFEHNYSSAAYTMPSHFSIFTGVSALTHGMEVDDHNRQVTTHRLSPEFWTMAEYFKHAGYKTFWSAWLTDPQLDLGADIARGFDDLERSYLDQISFQIPDNTEVELRLKLRQAAKQPSFLFLHTYSAHDPYKPTEPFYKMFAPGLSLPLETDRDVLVEVIKQTFESKSRVFAFRAKWLDQFKLPSPQGAKRLSDLYDAGLRHLDEKLELLFRMLKEEKLFDNSIIVITSDHGESFGSHGQFFHNSPYLDLLRVPLIVKMPGVPPRRVAEPVYGVDVLPTVLELAGLKPRENVEGESLAPLMYGRPITRKTQKWFAVGNGNRTVLEPHWQLMRWNSEDVELFDRVKDPRGIHDVAAKYPAEVKRLEAELSAYEASRPRPAERAPLSRPAKLYWFSIEDSRAGRTEYPLFKRVLQGSMPHLRLMFEYGLAGVTPAELPVAEIKNAVPQALIVEKDLSGEKKAALTARFEVERLNLSAELDGKSADTVFVRLKLPKFSSTAEIETAYRGLDRLLTEAFRRRTDNTYVVMSVSGHVPGPFLIWGPQVRQGRQLKEPVSSRDLLNYVLRVTGAEPRAKINDPELAGTIEFVR